MPTTRGRLRGVPIAVIFFLVAGYVACRVVWAPIQGTAAWFAGILAGLLAGAAGLASLWLLLTRGGFVAGTFTCLAAVALGAVVAGYGGRPRVPLPEVTTGWLAGTFTYIAVALASVAALLVWHGWERSGKP